MEQIGELPDAVPRPPHEERRRSVRQRLHTPVYASFNGPLAGTVVDLSELLDLHEDGFAVRTSERLDKDRVVTICLDLPETNSYVHGSGQVIWSDDSGRGGIRFTALPDESRKILKEWLFANLLIGSSNHAARSQPVELQESGKGVLVDAEAAIVNSNIIVNGESDILASAEAGRSEVRESAENRKSATEPDAALQVIAERALTLTAASGAALALFAGSGGDMICRARAGEPAPPLGAPVDASHGLSGECVRSGQVVSCEDTEKDSRVDAEVCRALGIRSLMAVPVFSDSGVVGLLEIFSPQPGRFTKIHGLVLQQLVEIVPRPAAEPAAAPSTTTGEQPAPGEDDATAAASSSNRRYRTLLGLTLAGVVIAFGYLAGPWVKNWVDGRAAEKRGKVVQMAPATTPAPVSAGQSLPEPNAAEQAGQRPAGQSQASADLKSGEHDSTGHGPVHRATAPPSLPDLRLRANRGDADAQWQMGVRYHDGEGVAQSDAEAVRWFQLAAEKGNVAAQSALGAYYWRGRGVPVDLSKAYFWSTIAMAEGDDISKSRVEGLSSQMTKEQVAAARQQAEAWVRNHNLRAKSVAQ